MAEKDAGVVLDMDQIDYDDPKVLELIGSGKTEGCLLYTSRCV